MRDLNRYQVDYQSLPFEAIQVRYRRRKVLDILTRLAPAAILEVGCGLEPLFAVFEPFGDMHVVEPASHFYDRAAALAAQRAGVTVHHGTLEECAPRLAERHFDCIVISSLLHEVDDPSALLGAARTLCSDTTVLHVNVPNAHSFHRLLAVQMGLIKNAHDVSATQQRMQQAASYDLASLQALLARADFEVIDSGSYFVKPFTHAQMAAMHAAGLLTDAMLDGLDRMVEYLPGLGSEIYVNAKRRD